MEKLNVPSYLLTPSIDACVNVFFVIVQMNVSELGVSLRANCSLSLVVFLSINF